jgi:hypothetical protein
LTASNRKLDAVEARRLLSIEEARRIDEQSRNIARQWPGTYNLKLLAEAVKNRQQFVEFEPDYQRFIIRYDDNREMVFIKPADNKFFPCGYFGYDRLKAVVV